MHLAFGTVGVVIGYGFHLLESEHTKKAGDLAAKHQALVDAQYKDVKAQLGESSEAHH